MSFYKSFPAGGTESPLTTKGDLFSYDTDDARLGIGTNGQILTADSAEALGLKWANAPTGTGDLLADGSIPLTADWDIGSFKITAQQLEADIASGTAPLIVASNTVVTNLNASLLEGNAASAFATAAQGSTADSALQDITTENLTDLADVDTDKSKTPADGDVLTFDGTDWNAEVSAGGGGLTASEKTGAYTVLTDEDVGVDSSGGVFDITLKLSPGAGDVVYIRDTGYSCGTNPVGILRNGETIDGVAADESLNVDGGVYMFIFNGTTWKFTPITVGGLNQTQVDARVDVGLAAHSSITYNISNLADDDVWELDLGTDVYAANAIISDNQPSPAGGIFMIRAASSLATCVAISASGITASTGIHTGTTGVDTELTIATHTDNKIYVENRKGGVRTLAITINNPW